MAMPIIKISYWQPWLIMGLGLLSLAAAANSHEKWYQIEVLIFSSYQILLISNINVMI
jgi:hypothetical protein